MHDLIKLARLTFPSCTSQCFLIIKRFLFYGDVRKRRDERRDFIVHTAFAVLPLLWNSWLHGVQYKSELNLQLLRGDFHYSSNVRGGLDLSEKNHIACIRFKSSAGRTILQLQVRRSYFIELQNVNQWKKRLRYMTACENDIIQAYHLPT